MCPAFEIFVFRPRFIFVFIFWGFVTLKLQQNNYTNVVTPCLDRDVLRSVDHSFHLPAFDVGGQITLPSIQTVCIKSYKWFKWALLCEAQTRMWTVNGEHIKAFWSFQSGTLLSNPQPPPHPSPPTALLSPAQTSAPHSTIHYYNNRQSGGLLFAVISEVYKLCFSRFHQNNWFK